MSFPDPLYFLNIYSLVIFFNWVTLDHFWKYMLNCIRNVKFMKMRKLTMFISAVCLLFLWLSNFSAHEKFHSVTSNDPVSWLLQQRNQKSIETEQDKLKERDMIS